MERFTSQWAASIREADSPEARQALLHQVQAWCAANLTDIAGVRQATAAQAALYALLGDRKSAKAQVNALISLLQSPPHAPDSELRAARKWLRNLDGKAPAKQTKKAKAKVTEALTARDKALKLALDGRRAEASKRLARLRGPAAELAYAWVELTAALDLDDAQARAQALAGLQQDLRARVLRGSPLESMVAAVVDKAQDTVDSASAELTGVAAELRDLLGRAPAQRLGTFFRTVDAYADHHPDQLDLLVSKVLRYHLEFFGTDRPSPRVQGLVIRALATGEAPLTQAVIADLDVSSVTLAEELNSAYCKHVIDTCARAVAQGYELQTVRRGILPAKSEPADFRPWTARLRKGRVDVMIGFMPTDSVSCSDELAAQFAKRFQALSALGLLVAPGEAGAAVRGAAAVLQVHTLDALDSEAIVGRLDEIVAAAPAGKAPVAQEEAKVQAPQAESKKRSRGPSPAERLRAVLSGEADQSVDEALGGFNRFYHAFGAVKDMVSTMEAPQADQVVATLAEALDRVAPGELRLVEGTTWLVRAAATGQADSQSRDLLLGGQTRFGSEVMTPLIEVARGLVQDGWQILRVHEGITRRERRNNPALDALAENVGQLWRVDIRRGEVEGEVWWIADLTEEGRAAAPQLMVEESPRVVMLPMGSPLLSWYGELDDAPPAVAYTDDALSGVRELVGSWSAPIEA